MSKLMNYIINWLPRACYLLRDEFTGSDAAPLASPRICTHVGQLILDQTDGQFSIVNGEFTWPAQTTPAWGDQDWYALKNDGDEYDVLGGQKLILKFRGAWLTHDDGRDAWFGFNLDNTPGAPAGAEHTFRRGVALGLGIRCTSGGSDLTQNLRDLWSANLGDYFQTSIVLRPYTVAGLHWYPEAAGTFAYGAHFFWKDETADPSHHLLAWYRQLQSRTDPLYPAFSNYSTAGKFDYTYIPCDDTDIWHPLFTPIAYDEFTDANGVTLPNHTMTYGGYTWVNAAGVWDINTNQADPSNVANAISYVPTLTPDVWDEASMLIPTGVSNEQGLTVRKSADTSGGTNHWRLTLKGNTAGADTIMTERNDGVATTRATADNDWADNTTYNLRVRCDGLQITFYVDYVERLHYATAWFNRHATWHGLYAHLVDAARFDNFIILPRGTGLERIAYDAFTDPNGTSLDAHTMDEGGLAWVEDVGDWDIQGNEASTSVGVANNAHAHAVTTVSNIWITGRVLVQGVGVFNPQGLCLRKSADTGGGANMWRLGIMAGIAGNDTRITEIDDGVATIRAQGDGDYVAGTRYYLQAHAEGQTISVYVDGTLLATYATATFNETATWHGLMIFNRADTRIDQFRITEIPTLGEYDAALDGI